MKLDRSKLEKKKSRIVPGSKMNRVRQNLDEIEKARAAGYTWATIAAALGAGLNEKNVREFVSRLQLGAAPVKHRQAIVITDSTTVVPTVEATEKPTVATTVGATQKTTPHATVVATVVTTQRPPEAPMNSGVSPVPSDEEYKFWPVADKIKWGKPETSPDGSRYFVPLSTFEIKQLEIWAQHDRCDAGEL